MRRKTPSYKKSISFDRFFTVIRSITIRYHFSLFLSAYFVFLARSAAMSAASGPGLSEVDTAEVTVERSDQDRETIYRIFSGDCVVEWILRDFEKGVIKHASRCAVPLAEQLPLLKKICAEFFSRKENAQAFRILFWGTLEPERKPSSLEMPFRLALAARQSPGWDAIKGKPKNGDINRFVRDLANRERIYPELKELFAHFQKSVTLAVVEKVRVQRAGDLPFYDRLKQHGVQAADRLPFDCMAWFSVSSFSQE